MKKGALAIEYIFIIFIAVITVFVIVGMLTNWSFGAQRYISRLTEEDKIEVPDIQLVLDTNPASVLEKHQKLCKEKCEKRIIKSNLCYVIANKAYNPAYILSCENGVAKTNGVIA